MGKGFHSFSEPLLFALAQVRPDEMLEWGPGLSTELMLAGGAEGSRLVSIEHDPRWVSEIRTKLGDVERWDLREVPCTDRDSSYATCALAFGRQFDLIFIDGRRRIECLLVALKVIRSGGLILLDDFCRTNYQCLVEGLPHCEVIRVQANTAIMRRR